MKMSLQLGFKVVSNYNVAPHTLGLTGALLADGGVPNRHLMP
jgi:hypothetical protein